MYLRTISRKNKDGSVVRYLQLAHNVRNEKGQAQANVVYSFGREDTLDRDALARLVKSISRFLEPGIALEAGASPEISFISSKPVGCTYLLDSIWERVGIVKAIKELLKERPLKLTLSVSSLPLLPTGQLIHNQSSQLLHG